MKLYIEISFFDALMDLPKVAQKKARDFLKKFQADPKSPGIHLEKIAQWKQPELRSARVDQGYRAVVYQSQREDIFRLLWVGAHDVAYQWPMNKQFAWNEQVQSFQVFEVQAEASVMPPGLDVVEAPTEAAKPEGVFTQLKDEQLLRLGVPEAIVFRVREILNEEQFWSLEPFLPRDAFEYLFYFLEGESFEQLVTQIEAGKAQVSTAAEVFDSPNAMRFSRRVDEETDLDKILAEGQEKWMVFLHPSQQQLAYRSFPGSVKVTGGAGTGKTVVALHRVKYLVERTNGADKKPILFTTFTKRLTAVLRNQAESLGLNPEVVHIQSIHKLAWEVGKKLGLLEGDLIFLDNTQKEKEGELWSEALEYHLSEFSPTQLMEEYHAVVLDQDIQTEEDYLNASRLGRTFRVSRPQRKAIWGVFETFNRLKRTYRMHQTGEVFNQIVRYLNTHPELRPYRHVVCDELQDLSNLELRFLRSLTPEGPDDLFLVGDPLQKIYSRKLTLSSAGINVKGRRSQRLKLNYRTTYQIQRLAISTIKTVPISDLEDGEEPKNGYISLMKGLKPEYNVFITREEEFAKIVQILRSYESEKIEWRDMAVAAPRKEQVKALQMYFKEAGIPAFSLIDELGVREGVRLSTFHTLKGLEFRTVILTHLDTHSIPSRPRDFESWSKAEQYYHDQQERSLLYVAMSRAVRNLHLTGMGRKCEWIQI